MFIPKISQSYERDLLLDLLLDLDFDLDFSLDLDLDASLDLDLDLDRDFDLDPPFCDLDLDLDRDLDIIDGLLWGFGGCWRFLTGVCYFDLDLNMVASLR